MKKRNGKDTERKGLCGMGMHFELARTLVSVQMLN